MITRISSVIRPKGSDLIFDHTYNAEYLHLSEGGVVALSSADQPVRCGLTAIRYRRSRAAPAAVLP